MVYVLVLEAEMSIYPVRVAQMAILQRDKIPTKISMEYTDYPNIFSFNLAIELPENTGINKHTIELVEGK